MGLASGEDLHSPVVTDMHRIEGLSKGYFNAAAWRADNDPDSPTLLLVRDGTDYEKRGVPGEPDVGALALAIVMHGRLKSVRKVWEPEPKEAMGDILEDPRVLTKDPRAVQFGDLVIGLTRLRPDKNNGGKYKPFPAIATTSFDALLDGQFPPTSYISDLTQISPNAELPPGKNTTPLIVPGRRRHLIYREEDANHKLTIVQLGEGGVAEKKQGIITPEDQIPYWGKFKMGTTMSPVWLNDREALLLPHGIRMVRGRYVYAIGSARLFIGNDGAFGIDNVSKHPHLTSDSFRGILPKRKTQFRPKERTAIYACGGTYDPERREITLYPSVGDNWTVKTILSVDAITSGWDRLIK